MKKDNKLEAELNHPLLITEKTDLIRSYLGFVLALDINNVMN
jgi:hypothetical protein